MKHLELHILQSVPVTCLNRDDLGSPKTAFLAVLSVPESPVRAGNGQSANMPMKSVRILRVNAPA